MCNETQLIYIVVQDTTIILSRAECALQLHWHRDADAGQLRAVRFDPDYVTQAGSCLHPQFPNSGLRGIGNIYVEPC